MSKELYFTDGNNEVKYLDTTASFNLAITQDGSAFDLTNATAIDVKVANDTGYVFDKSIDMTTITQPLAGLITMPVDAEVMNALVPDDYTIEVWVTLSSLITPGSQEGLTDGATTSTTTDATTYNAIFPSDDPQGFTITDNVMSDSGEVIPVMSLDEFQQEFNQLKTDLTNKVSTLQGPKGDPGEGLDIKGQVTSVSALPTTANEGDGYLVNGELYVWTNGAWKDCGSLQGPQGVQGKTGTGVSSTTIKYQIANSATTTPTGTWSNSLIATTQDNPFLWTQVTLNYDDITSKSFYLVSSKGDKGDTGAKGQSVWSFPHDIGANANGRWWSDLKPTPTTANPPKVGDTIVDLIGNVYQITNVVVGTTQEGGGTFDFGNLLTSIKGPKGDTGPVGAGLVVKGTLNNASQLPTTGNQEGYCYFVGTDLYVWDAGTWKNCGSVSPDLSNYVTVTDLNNGLSTKVTDNKNGTISVNGTNILPADENVITRIDGTYKDMNDIPMGWFYVNGWADVSGLSNWGLPQGFYYVHCFKSEYGSHANIQIAYNVQINNTYVRTMSDTTWTTWKLLADDSKVVHSTDMRKPASDVAGIEEVNAKQDKIGYTPADDSKVAHLSGANNFDTVPTVNNNPLLLASSLPSDLARTGSNQEFTGKNTFDTAPIDKATGNPYITKDGVPAVPSTLADTTKDANFTGKLQKSGIDVATKSDVTTAVSTATANMVDSSKTTNFTAGLQSGGVDVATAADLKSVADKAWYQLDNKYITPDSESTLSSSTNILYRIDDSNHTLYLSGSVGANNSTGHHATVTVQLGSIIKSIKTYLVPYLGYTTNSIYTAWSHITPSASGASLTFTTFEGVASIAPYPDNGYRLAYVTYDELV